MIILKLDSIFRASAYIFIYCDLSKSISMWTVARRINGMEQNMLREDQALPIRGLALHTGRQNQVTSTKRFIRGVTVFIKH